MWDPTQVAVTHCWGHQAGTDHISKGNAVADQEAKQAAMTPCGSAALELAVHAKDLKHLGTPEEKWAWSEGGTKEPHGCWGLAEACWVMP